MVENAVDNHAVALLRSFRVSVPSYAEMYSEPYQTYKMELLAKIINDFQQLSIFPKSFVSDV